MKTAALAILLVFSITGFSNTFIINEVLASNRNTDSLQDGSTPDWIELLNTEDQAANLKGYTLMNKAGATFVFPDTAVAPGAMVVVYAHSGAVAGVLTCTFSISAADDAISLFDHSTVLIDKITVKNMPGDVSVGRKSGKTSFDYWFGVPTLGKPNVEQAYTAEALAEPVFSFPAGKCQSAVRVALTSNDPAATIYYTIDGTVPTRTNGIKYTDSISISQSIPIQAIAIKPSYWPSKTATSTYLILKRNITLPVVALTVDPADMFDETTGMYMMGPNADTQGPYFGANFWQDWERPVHVEIFETDGHRIADVNAGIQIAGDRSRANNQKSFSIHCRDRYGDENIKCRLFEDKPIDVIKNITLRNSGGDFSKTQMRDGFISTLVADLDFDRMAYRPAVLFINGTYWGVQNIREKISEDFLAENHGIDPDSVNLLEKHNKVKEGSNKEYIDLLLFMADNPVSEPQNYEYVANQIEIQNFIDYMNTELYIVNVDWPGNNIRYWKTPGRKWRWILYDTDLGYDNCFTYCIYGSTDAVSQKMLAYATQKGNTDWPNPDWSTYMLRKLLTNESFKHRFVNSMADRLNTTFQPANAVKIIDSLQAKIRTEMYYHSQRWDLNYDKWFIAVQTMKDFARDRPQYVWSDYVDFFGFSGLFTLNLSISDNNAGTIVLNSIKADSLPWTGQYFQNVPISLTALPKPGFRFVRWEGASTAQESNIVINTDEVCDLKAVFESDPGSVSQVGINEIMYNDAEELGSSDWIELVNNGGAAADISGWVLKNEKPFTSFPIPQGTVIAPGQYMVVSKDSTAFRQVYRASATGNLGFDLSEDRDIVRLIDRYGNLIDEVRYFDHYPWPSKADGAGSSIELQAGADASQPASWCACAAGGTPLAVNCVAPADGPKTIVITEINYKDSPNAKTGDWFELLNNGTEIVDLSGWYVQDKAGNMMVFTSGTSLMPGEYLVLANDPLNFKIAYPQVQNVAACSVKLGSDEEMILLWDDTGALVDSVAYTSRAPWPTSASGTGYTLVLKDDLSDNSLPINWTTGVRLGTPGAADSSIRSSIDTQATLHAVTVYPNPAREILQVIAPIGTSIVISTMLGLPVLQLAKTKSTFTQISISKLSTGTYRISYSSEYSSGSIIIAKY